jgi:hypothetical protein
LESDILLMSVSGRITFDIYLKYSCTSYSYVVSNSSSYPWLGTTCGEGVVRRGRNLKHWKKAYTSSRYSIQSFQEPISLLKNLIFISYLNIQNISQVESGMIALYLYSQYLVALLRTGIPVYIGLLVYTSNWYTWYNMYI